MATHSSFDEIDLGRFGATADGRGGLSGTHHVPEWAPGDAVGLLLYTAPMHFGRDGTAGRGALGEAARLAVF